MPSNKGVGFENVRKSSEPGDCRGDCLVNRRLRVHLRTLAALQTQRLLDHQHDQIRRVLPTMNVRGIDGWTRHAQDTVTRDELRGPG